MTIICIDDDPALRELTARALSKAGFRVHTGGNARAALELAQRYPDASLIILDIHMPEITGFQALEILKQDSKLRHIPVLVLSGTAKPDEDRATAIGLGAVDLLTYPIQDDELVARVKKAVAAGGAK